MQRLDRWDPLLAGTRFDVDHEHDVRRIVAGGVICMEFFRTSMELKAILVLPDLINTSFVSNIFGDSLVRTGSLGF